MAPSSPPFPRKARQLDGMARPGPCGGLSRGPDGPEQGSGGVLKGAEQGSSLVSDLSQNGQPLSRVLAPHFQSFCPDSRYRLVQLSTLSITTSVVSTFAAFGTALDYTRCRCPAATTAPFRHHIVGSFLHHVLLNLRFDLEACKRRDTTDRDLQSALHSIFVALFNSMFPTILACLTVIRSRCPGNLVSASSSNPGPNREFSPACWSLNPKFGAGGLPGTHRR